MLLIRAGIPKDISAHGRNALLFASLSILAVDDEPETLGFYSEFFSSLETARSDNPESRDLEAKLFEAEAASDPGVSFEYESCSQGPEAVERIRKIDPHVNIAIVTGFSDFDPKVIAEKVPPVDKLLYLRKPLHPEEIRHLAVSLSEKWIVERELKISEERYALAARGTADGIWDWNLADDRIFFSERWKVILGYENKEIGDSPEEWYSWIPPEDIGHFKFDFSGHLKGRQATFLNEHRLLHRNGKHIYVLCRGMAACDPDGKPYRIAGSITDITGRKLAEKKLLHDALHDSLTGLSNRAHFVDRLKSALEHIRRQANTLFAVLFLDLDRFKVVNDSLGHLAGDRLLMGVAKRIADCSRKTDFVARYNRDNTVARLGGDEFIVLLEELKDTRDAVRVAERILTALQKSFLVDAQELFVSASIGIAIGGLRYTQPEEILRDADIAMYQAKNRGRGTYEIFDAAMHKKAINQLHLETDLKKALPLGQFKLVFQPIVSIVTRRIEGFEALIRRHHPERGQVSPAEFIPLAEETNLIVSIGNWVLKTAFNQVAAWRRQVPERPIFVTVNISRRQFSHPGFLDELEAIVSETQADPTTIKLEITESVLMENRQAVHRLMCDLKALGFELYMDDFGTGYSSLSYLHQFPFDGLKIDQSFILNVQKGSQNWEIAKTIIVLGQNLGLKVTAEGVETAEHLSLLEQTGCHYAQGFFFHKPLDPGQASELLKR